MKINVIGMIPFLGISGAPTEAECRAKVAEIEAIGADSFLLYARSGLQVEYMGEEWLQIAEWFCDEAFRRNMKVWIYDEYNWPSGTCKGCVPRENGAWRYRETGVFQREGGGWFWQEAKVPAGWVNVCEPDSVRRFIELTHEVYFQRLSRYFASGTIVGFFTDEPGHPVAVAFDAGLPIVAFRTWSGLDDEYRAETGREFRSDVEAWLDSGKTGDMPAIYARLLGRRFRTSFFDQIRDWCDAHGVAFTGHMIEENGLGNSCRFNGDPMLCLRGESIPGIDDYGTGLDPDGKAGKPVEWITLNLARQAILHNGIGGMAELFACGPGDLSPAAMRQMIWLCAFHGIDRYLTAGEVLDERGFVEKNGYISAAGSVHPWYRSQARILTDESRRAALFAGKCTSEREVAVRYPNHAAAIAAFGVRPEGPWSAGTAKVPDALGLLCALETHQFTCRFVQEDEPCDLPLVFVCRPDGRFNEERTGSSNLGADDAVALCRKMLPSSFRVLDADGRDEADALLLRTCSDGTSAIMNMRPFASRRLVAERGSGRCSFVIPPRGIRVFQPGELPPDEPCDDEVRYLAATSWALRRDSPNLLRVNFTENDGRSGRVIFANCVEACPVLRDFAVSYAVTSSGRPVGAYEGVPVGERVIRHDAEPYSFAADGEALSKENDAPASALPVVFASLYRAAATRTFAAGVHSFDIVSGEPDVNYFLPALWLAGDFRVLGGCVFPESETPVVFGSFADMGFPHYVGGLTWHSTVAAPTGNGWRFRADTGGSVASVRFCGVELGARAWPPFEWCIPTGLSGRIGELEITIFSSAQPMFGRYDTHGAIWGQPLWFGDHAPGMRCGLFSATWVKS